MKILFTEYFVLLLRYQFIYGFEFIKKCLFFFFVVIVCIL